MDQQLEYAIYFVEIIGENTINRFYSVTDRNTQQEGKTMNVKTV